MLSTGKLNRKEDRKVELSGLSFRSSFPRKPCGHALRAPLLRVGHCAGLVEGAAMPPLLLAALAFPPPLLRVSGSSETCGFSGYVTHCCACRHCAGWVGVVPTPPCRPCLHALTSCSAPASHSVTRGARRTRPTTQTSFAPVAAFLYQKITPGRNPSERKFGWSDEPDAPGLCPPSSYPHALASLRYRVGLLDGPPQQAAACTGASPPSPHFFRLLPKKSTASGTGFFVRLAREKNVSMAPPTAGGRCPPKPASPALDFF